VREATGVSGTDKRASIGIVADEYDGFHQGAGDCAQ